MRKIVQRLLNILRFIGLSALSTLVVAGIVALRHMIDTPQPLESILPGTAHIYRWRYGHIFYKTLGNKDALPLVLLHAPSLGGSAYEMRKIMGALAQRYHVYALDLPGFGLSDHPRMDYSAETYITLCHDFLTEVVGQPATLVASGLSCNYAVITAKRFPQTCSRLVLISPLELFGAEQAPNLLSELVQQPLTRFLLYTILSTRTVLRYVLSRLRSPHLGQISVSDVDYHYATTHQFGAEHAVLARLAGKLAVDASQLFDALQQPALIIWGARALNNARLITNQQHMPVRAEIALIQEAGISVHEEYPALVVANILEWSEADKTGIEHLKQKVDEIRYENEEPLLAYCVKCKSKTAMQDTQQVTMKNGSPAVKGKCSICGTGQYRIGRL